MRAKMASVYRLEKFCVGRSADVLNRGVESASFGYF